MPGQAATTVGARLREAREQRGVTLRQIAERTRISVMALEALERNDIKRLPGGIFTRAFLRSYASEVGLNPDQTVQDFLAQFPHEPVATSRPTTQIEDNQVIESDRRMAETVMRLLFVAIPVAGFVIYLGLRQPSRSSSPVAPPASVAEPVAETKLPEAIDEPAAVVQRTPPAAVAAAPAVAPALTMVITPQSDCWVSPTVDGEKMTSALLAGGQRRELKALKEIVLTVGDGGACTYTLNGSAGKPLGAAGEVVTRRINLDNYRSYLP